MPIRIQRKRTRGWRLPPNTVIVSRPTKWGNPFVSHGDGATMVPSIAVGCFRSLLEKEKAWFSVPLPWPAGKIPAQLTTVEDVKRELRGKDLACWCPLTDSQGNLVPCHADILLEIANS